MPKYRIQDGLQFLLLASFLTILVWFVPGAWLAVYPFRLFVTFIHEAGHALAALVTLGVVDRIVIHLDGSGETYSRGGIPLVIASAGYLASTIYGASLLVLCRDGRNAKTALTVTAGVILLLTIFFAHGRLSMTTGVMLSLGVIAIAVVATERAAHFFMSFLAVQCCLNAVFDLRTLFVLSASSDTPSDAFNMERMTGVPAIFWALLWIVGSAVVLWTALKSHSGAMRRVVRRRRV